ncbi:hypothetical protein HPP92_013459 [Vanilla planifolia]|uniref:Secreted protein n=1 Tax=Vanilla planifolia TaxID=51239 RepID=A0A835UWP5_VANPL|nr:hypothetical protein HPP92_013459 [Vanilla planifolia]
MQLLSKVSVFLFVFINLLKSLRSSLVPKPFFVCERDCIWYYTKFETSSYCFLTYSVFCYFNSIFFSYTLDFQEFIIQKGVFLNEVSNCNFFKIIFFAEMILN